MYMYMYMSGKHQITLKNKLSIVVFLGPQPLFDGPLWGVCLSLSLPLTPVSAPSSLVPAPKWEGRTMTSLGSSEIPVIIINLKKNIEVSNHM